MKFLDDADTRFAVTAERSALNALGGGCQVPIGVYCVRMGEEFLLRGAVAQPDGRLLLRAETRGVDAVEMGTRLAQHLLEQGAMEILQAGKLP